MEKTTIYQFEDGIKAMELKSWIMIETQYNAKVRVLRSDNGGEY